MRQTHQTAGSGVGGGGELEEPEMDLGSLHEGGGQALTLAECFRDRSAVSAS